MTVCTVLTTCQQSRRAMLILTAIVCCLASPAQQRRVVIDVETFVPVAGANVKASHQTVTTDSLGWFTVSDSCRTLILSHVNYESRLVNTDEVGDTIFMISKLLNLKEVVVFGHAKYRDDFKELKKQLRLEKTEAQLIAADPSSGGNLLPLLTRLIPKRWQKNTKKARRKRLKQILEDY